MASSGSHNFTDLIPWSIFQLHYAYRYVFESCHFLLWHPYWWCHQDSGRCIYFKKSDSLHHLKGEMNRSWQSFLYTHKHFKTTNEKCSLWSRLVKAWLITLQFHDWHLLSDVTLRAIRLRAGVLIFELSSFVTYWSSGDLWFFLVWLGNASFIDAIGHEQEINSSCGNKHNTLLLYSASLDIQWH